MSEPTRVVLAAVLMVVGVAAAGYAGYRQYGALPGEHTLAHAGMRLALAVGGVALIVGGGQLIP